MAFSVPLAQPDQPHDQNETVLHQKADLLRDSHKWFGTFQGTVDGSASVKLRMEDNGRDKLWSIDADAEIGISGTWGRLEDLRQGDRVWVWIRPDRAGDPSTIFLMVDEISEQWIQDRPYTVAEITSDENRLVVERKGDNPRNLKLAPSIMTDRLQTGDTVYIQSSGDVARLVLSETDVVAMIQAQQVVQYERWAKSGLPGTVTFLHRLAGEMEVMIDHQALHWARHLAPDDSILINTQSPIPGVVLGVEPWREKTRFRIAVRGQDLADLRIGERVRIQVPSPPEDVLNGPLPAGLGRERSRDERVRWFLSSIYCSCRIPFNTCTGQYFTLAGCNPKTCGMPNTYRGKIEEFLDQGLDDGQILAELQKKYGDIIRRPHLRP